MGKLVLNFFFKYFTGTVRYLSLSKYINNRIFVPLQAVQSDQPEIQESGPLQSFQPEG